jgi:hypothetical protein
MIMDADEVAVTIASLLHAAGLQFKYKAEGDRIGSDRTLAWNSIVVEVEHPLSGELHRLHTLEDARKFMGSLPT